jgi:sensor histidine kinase YesM
MSKNKLYSDKWVMIIGIPLVGVVFPFLLGLKFGDPDFYRWLSVSVLTTLVSWLSTRMMSIIVWGRFTWEKNPLHHILAEIGVFIVFGFITVLFTSVLYLLIFRPEGNFWHDTKYIRNGILVLYAMILLVHESIHLFFEWKKELTRAADLEKENIRSKFEALKNHVNPHFLFKSLGTLSSLIRTDPVKAEKYVNEFAGIYRYFLEVNNNELVTVAEELRFIRSYVFLQQIRFGEGFSFVNRVDDRWNHALMLPLTLELLVENALKHNTTLPSMPLVIEIFTHDERELLLVQNNFQPRASVQSTATGLKNLEQRYASFLGRDIGYRQEENLFIVEIPLITAAS